MNFVQDEEPKNEKLEKKTLPVFIPEKEPTLGFLGKSEADARIAFQNIFHFDLIEAVDCPGQGHFIEIKVYYL